MFEKGMSGHLAGSHGTTNVCLSAAPHLTTTDEMRINTSVAVGRQQTVPLMNANLKPWPDTRRKPVNLT